MRPLDGGPTTSIGVFAASTLTSVSRSPPTPTGMCPRGNGGGEASAVAASISLGSAARLNGRSDSGTPLGSLDGRQRRAELAHERALRHTGHVLPEDGDLRLDPGLGPQAAAVGQVVRHVLRLQATARVVVAVAHPHHELVLDGGAAAGRAGRTGRRPRPRACRRSAPSRRMRSTVRVSRPPSSSLEGGDEALPPVQQEDHVRQPLRPPAPRPAARRVGVAVWPSSACRRAISSMQPVEQPVGPLDLVALDDRPAVRQLGQRQQRAVAAVQAVQVDVPADWCGPAMLPAMVRSAVERPRPRRAGDAAGGRRARGRSRAAPGPGSPGRSSRPNGTRHPAGRVAGVGLARPARQRRPAATGSASAGSHGLRWRGIPAQLGRVADRPDQHLQVGLPSSVARPRACGRSAAAPEPLPADHASDGLGGGPATGGAGPAAADPAGLERDQRGVRRAARTPGRGCSWTIVPRPRRRR